MQLKKLLQGSAFALVAAACAIAVPSVVKAADGAFTDIGITSIQVNGVTGTMDIIASAADTKEVIVGIGKVNKKNAITVSSWGSYTPDSNKKVTVDLSKLNNVKDNYIVITTPAKESVSVVKIAATKKVTKAKFDVKTSKLLAASDDEKVDNNSLAALTDGAAGTGTGVDYQFKTPYSGWENVTDASNNVKDMTLYQEEGAKLVVRLKGVSDTGAVSTVAADADEVTYGTLKVKVYESEAKLPGKEVKVTVPAKGPKITADYAKGMVKFPNKSEYRIVTAKSILAEVSTGKYLPSPTSATEISEIAAKETEAAKAETSSFDIEVRTLATDKKPASKWSRLYVVKPAKISSVLTN